VGGSAVGSSVKAGEAATLSAFADGSLGRGEEHPLRATTRAIMIISASAARDPFVALGLRARAALLLPVRPTFILDSVRQTLTHRNP
jgi:hypothetical protein